MISNNQVDAALFGQGGFGMGSNAAINRDNNGNAVIRRFLHGFCRKAITITQSQRDVVFNLLTTH